MDKFGFSTFTLKIIAVVTMVIDHFAYALVNESTMTYTVLRSIGRISFPIFCFVLVEGYFHTHNRLEHCIRLGIFALISEVPFDAFQGDLWNLKHQNVLFTLFIGFVMIWGLDMISAFRLNYPEKLTKKIGAGRLNTLCELVVIMLGLGSAYILKSSYSYAGIMLILCFYAFHKQNIGKIVSIIVFNMGMYPIGIQWWGTAGILPIALYNEKPGKRSGKYFFYCFYPLHLMILVLVRNCMG